MFFLAKFLDSAFHRKILTLSLIFLLETKKIRVSWCSRVDGLQ